MFVTKHLERAQTYKERLCLLFALACPALLGAGATELSRPVLLIAGATELSLLAFLRAGAAELMLRTQQAHF